MNAANYLSLCIYARHYIFIYFIIYYNYLFKFLALVSTLSYRLWFIIDWRKFKVDCSIAYNERVLLLLLLVVVCDFYIDFCLYFYLLLYFSYFFILWHSIYYCKVSPFYFYFDILLIYVMLFQKTYFIYIVKTNK